MTPITTESHIENLNVAEFTPLVSPQQLKQELPRSEAAEKTVLLGRAAARSILKGEDQRLLVVVGPCSVHDFDQATEYANRLAKLREKVHDKLEIHMRVYVDKPRTTIGWRGALIDPKMDGSNDINEGLRLTRKLMLYVAELGLPVATELLDPFAPQFVFDIISWSCLGARTSESQTHRVMASAVSAPMGFKNGTGGSIKLAVDAMVAAQNPHAFFTIDHQGQACIVNTKGNTSSHLILRGGRDSSNYDAQSIAQSIELMKAAQLHPAIMIDCSHANSRSDYTNQAKVLHHVLQQRAAGQNAICGLMIESNLNSGKQKIPNNLEQLQYGVSVTDGCIGWEETETLLLETYQSLK